MKAEACDTDTYVLCLPLKGPFIWRKNQQVEKDVLENDC